MGQVVRFPLRPGHRPRRALGSAQAAVRLFATIAKMTGESPAHLFSRLVLAEAVRLRRRMREGAGDVRRGGSGHG